MWRGSLKLDLSFRHHVIFGRNIEGLQQVGRRKVSDVRNSWELDVSYARQDPGVPAQREALFRAPVANV